MRFIIRMNGWFYDSESENVKPMWYDGQQFPSSMRKLTKGNITWKMLMVTKLIKKNTFIQSPEKKKEVKRHKDISEKSTPEQALHPPLQICFEKKLKYI